MQNPAPTHRCSFCGDEQDAVELLFVSNIGGLPPEICAGCVDGCQQVAEAHRQSPELAAKLIAAHNVRAKLLARTDLKQPSE